MLENGKTLEELSDEEVRDEGLKLARRYMEKRGWDIVDDEWTYDGIDVIAKEESGCVVLVRVMVEADPDGDPYAMPELDIDGKRIIEYRQSMLAYLLDHPYEDAARFDILSIRLLSDHNAKLRHLVGAVEWDS